MPIRHMITDIIPLTSRSFSQCDVVTSSPRVLTGDSVSGHHTDELPPSLNSAGSVTLPRRWLSALDRALALFDSFANTILSLPLLLSVGLQ